MVEVPEPVLPNDDWVRIRVRLCGFCGSDLNLIQVKDSPMASPFTSFPCIFRHEVDLEIAETGASVNGLKEGRPGDREPVPNCSTAPRPGAGVCQSCASGRTGACESYAEGTISPGMFTGICRDVGGGFAEYMVVHKSQVFRVPDAVSDESASMTEPLSVGLQAVLDNRPRDGEKVLVIGGGVIGTMIVKAIRGLGIGCSVTVVEPSPFNAQFVKASGADHVVSGNIIDAAVEIAGAKAYKPMLGERIVQGDSTASSTPWDTPPPSSRPSSSPGEGAP